MSVVFIKTPFPKLKFGYTNNTQGFSKGKFAKFNLSDNVGDNPLAVEKNRNLFKSCVNANVKWLKQNHTTIIKSFDEYDEGFCDAIYTNKPNQVCTVLTADCLPILLFDKRMTKVAAVHAGWKGLAHGILEVSLKEFIGFDLVAWFGPCITQPYYEVGQDVYDSFVNQDEIFGQAFRSKGENKYLFDIKFIAKQILNSNHCFDVVDSGLCTFSNKRFYSYRKEGITGRQASFIWFE
ncbi:peptidoglycan editing factor PgeF [Allofrancisella guangzhouensis]|uniref:Purine nucleoside phosphorylase n=1 Tax=Allofrancisella guangzhouensis TaxID=594679 RepID=A0A0A8E6F2_9GAMM|nr:peptidoglycan editing factor PgeF [Allofrancisella guangzhouensis]AJC49157.1 polyphenol oxidase [Allofrancisella guangzhouensis]MBK2026785.1 peptidoglycan editing factor PgeF [Allofrancisella guangzhouensis]MBK2044022.1 peptidoglycan editing factor PgeF [Allofrancisella guangzhouensis]MBK2045330.1 peptidoglycan editing factor PgeF [Allofrancisella guangzhouensis]